MRTSKRESLVVLACLAASGAAGQVIGSQTVELTYINVGSVALALFLALVNNRIVEYFAVPIFERFHLDRQWLLYVSALTGFVLAMLANADLFAPGLFAPIASRIVSAIVIAGGSNLIADVIGGSSSPSRKSKSGESVIPF